MRRTKTLFRLSIALAVIIVPAGASTASAKTFVVTRHDDSRPGTCTNSRCSLRAAISAANARPGGDVVALPDTATYKLSRENPTQNGEDTNSTGDLDVADELTIRHPGKGMATIDANGIDRVLDVLATGSAEVVKVRLTGGNDPFYELPTPGGAPAPGGGVRSEGPLTLIRSVVTRNRVVEYGGGLEAYGRVTIKHSNVSHNSTETSVGGGIDGSTEPVLISDSTIAHNHAGNAGGGVVSAGKLRIIRSTVARNVAEVGATGVYATGGPGQIVASTIDGNISHDTGGGVEASDASLAIVNSTIASNRADLDGGGIRAIDSDITLNGVTIARNTADADANGSGIGGGISIYTIVPGSVFTVENTILAGNHAGNLADDCNGDFLSGGGNLVQTNGGCTGFGAPADLIGGDPRLGSLADNGGATRTLALKKGSDAIGLALPGLAPPQDQRGRKRDKHPDSGAFERGA